MTTILVIRAEQMNAFRRQLTADMARRLRDAISHQSPDLVAQWPAAALPALIDKAIATAHRHGIVAEDHLLHFLELVLQYGPQFGAKEATPWAWNILHHPSLTPDEKLRLLDGYSLFGDGRTPK
ncbi:MAG: hypothetical protein JNK48_27255 [Bryobacterales bacterium]|nr:hypothetical protein [Bryobacterales bacterium]